jgi:hypothetical protein
MVLEQAAAKVVAAPKAPGGTADMYGDAPSSCNKIKRDAQ